MIRKRRYGQVAILLITALMLCGCASGEGTKRYAYPLATASPEDTVTQLYAEKFAEEVERLSEGSIQIQVYANSVLGGDRELLESCYDGDIPFVVQNTAPQVNFIPDTAVFDLPCQFDNLEEVRKAVDNPTFFEEMQRSYREAGYELLGYADQGFRVMSTNKKIEHFQDFKGQKVRTMENSYHIQFFKALGANPTPMNFSEVYIGLQQNTIDAQENPYEVIASNRLYEQQDYVINTNHLPHLISLIVSEEFYEQLSVKEQKILAEAQRLACDYARKEADLRISQRMKEIEDSGTKILELSDDTWNEMKAAAMPVREEIQKNVSEKIIESYAENS